MSPFTIFLLVLLFLIAVYRYARPPLSVPYATASIPLVGPMINFGMNPIAYLQKQRKLHGDVFCIDLLFMRITFNVSRSANAMFARKGEAELRFLDMLEDTLGASSVKWLKVPECYNKLSHDVMHGFGNQESLDIFRDAMLVLIRETYEEWAKKPSINLFDAVSDLVLGCMLITLLGRDFYDKHGIEFARTTLDLENYLQSALAKLVPRWATSLGRTITRNEKMWQDCVGEEIDKRLQQEVETPGYLSQQKDHLSQLLLVDGQRFREGICTHIQTFMIAGHTNAAASFGWMLSHAISTPEVFEAIKSELQDRDSHHPYTTACFSETGRLYSNMMLLRKIGRQAYTLITPDSAPIYYLPYNEFLAISPALVQRDPAIYGDFATSFCPERILAEGEDYIPGKRKRHEFMQFGTGLHACKGEKFAKMLIVNCLWGTLINEGYKFEAVEGLKVYDAVDIGESVNIKGLEERGMKDKISWERVVAGGRRDVDRCATGVMPNWAEENLGTPFARNSPLVKLVRGSENK